MKARLVQIGNSRGIRLPKLLIEEVGLEDEVELRVREGAIVISPVNGPRAGWEEAAREMPERNEDRLLEQAVPTHFDAEEWAW